MTKQQDEYEKALIYGEIAPDRAVADYVLCGWTFVANEDLEGTYSHHVVPDGCISLIYRAGRQGSPRLLLISGPHVKELRVEVRAGDEYWGIKFWPDAGGAILGVDPFILRGRSDLLAVRCPGHAQVLSGLLAPCAEPKDSLPVLQGFVSSRLPLREPLDAAIRQSILEIHRCEGSGEVGQIATTVGLSQRQFQRRFRASVGLTPKEYARIRRVRVALANAITPNPKGWAAVAVEKGYADQSHLSRDASALTGLTPAGFQTRVQPIDHRHFDP